MKEGSQEGGEVEGERGDKVGKNKGGEVTKKERSKRKVEQVGGNKRQLSGRPCCD